MTTSIQTVTVGSRTVYVLAQWDEKANQWNAPMTPAAQRDTGCHTLFGRNLERIARDPAAMRYATRSAARRALNRLSDI